MKATIHSAFLLALCSLLINTVHAQDQLAFNQNAARSNRNMVAASNAWSFDFSGGTAFAINSNEKTMFRGNGLAGKLSGHYYFNRIGLGFSSGLLTGSLSDNALNQFFIERRFPISQLQVSKANSVNSYLLAGPSMRFGNRVSVLADIKGGLFFNNPGSVTINQSGATGLLYRFEAGDKNMFPGFSGSISFAYPINSSIQFFINTDYFHSRSSVRLLDPGTGIDIPTQVNRDVKLLTAGIGIIKTFWGHHGSEAGKKHVGNVMYNEIAARDAASGRPSGRREMANTNATEPVLADQNCGPVTQRTTSPDGVTEEMTFACPADAAAYNQISRNVTVPKQTQGATFGEKVQAGLHAAGSALSQGRNIISGRLTWLDVTNSGMIVTNKSVRDHTGQSDASAGKGAESRQTNQSSFGTLVRMYAREAGSGMASGKREKGSGLSTGRRERGSGMASGKRERGSGMATGRRQYQPVYMDNSGALCDSCMANVKNNPLYTDKGIHGNNPLHTGRAMGDEDGIGSIDVVLVDINSGAILAQTKTEAGGDFFFANIPDGIYAVRIAGSTIVKKGYDISTTASTDLLGTVTLAAPPIQLYINTGEGDNVPQQRAGISTSRSNLRRSLAIVEADLDGDGEFESLTATATLSDGSTERIKGATGNSNGKKTIVLEGAALQNSRRRVEVLKSNKQGDPNANRITAITVSGIGNAITATASYSDGHKQDVTNQLVVNTGHNGVRQYNIMVADLDGDGLADAIVNNEMEMGGESTAKKMIPVTVPDITGENRNVAAPFVPGGTVVSAAMRPGTPIGGIIVKGGKNPGGALRTTETNEDGEFEFSNLDAGEYIFTLEQTFMIEDETILAVGNTTRAQDHNSSRSNKTASSIAPDPGSNDATAKSKAQDHNSSRSNKSGIVADGGGTGDVSKNKPTTVPIKWAAPELLKSISIDADLDGDGEYETDVTAKMSDEIMLDEKGDIIAPQQKAGVSTSRSNIRTRSSLQPVGNKLYEGYGNAEINGKIVPVKILYKGKATGGLKDTLKTQV